MSLKNDKALNASLIAFNNHIVGMKPVIKKAKVNEIQKLIRKIKLFTNKKGNEEQIEKNKKKCENLKNEIKHIKALKFNDIAVFAIDNDGTTFNDYLKINKGLTGEKIALARICFHKLVLDAINKMKTDPKVDGWKRTFIQYKARAEKRKNWKEKTRQLKEIEAKLKLNDDELKELESQDNQETEKKVEQNDKDQKPKEDIKPKEKTKKEIKLKERKVKFSDDESSSNEEADLSDDEFAEYNQPANANTTRPVKFSDGESTIDDYNEDDDEDEDNFPNMELHFTDEDDDDEEEDKESETKSEIEYVVEKFNKPKEEVNKLKPLVIVNKSAKMAIKQINLEEIKDCVEIPIDEIPITSGQVIENEKKDESESGPSENTIPLTSDPFFLDENGREIYNSNFDDDLNQTRNSFRRYNDRSFNNRNNYNNYNSSNSNFRNESNKEAFRNRRDNLNSSFKSSLSSSRPSNSSYNRRDNTNSSFSNDRNGFSKKDDNRNNSFKRPNNFNDKNDKNFKRTNFNNNSNYSRAQFKEKEGSFIKGSNKNINKTSDAPKSEDLAKFHPSWQAKKQMEEKLKNFKFEGKKVKFDDDD